MSEFVEAVTPFLNDTTRGWIIALAVTSIAVLSVAVIRAVLTKRLANTVARTPAQIDDSALYALGATRLWLVAVIALSSSGHYLALSPKAAMALKAAATVALFLQVGLWGNALIRFYRRNFHRRTTRAPRTTHSGASAASGLSAVWFIAQLALWAVVALLALDNLGINVTALVAGLGVGGIAVALAVQNILSDLFASLSIIVDKPFVIGDFIIVDNYMGTVENIGLKTTRIRSLDGEQIVFSNSDLLNTRIRNYKRMYERRVVFSLGVHYRTSADQLERIPRMLKEIVEAQGKDKVRFDRAHLQKFGDSSLDFEVVYIVLDADYNLYMDLQQAINLAIMRSFAKEKIEFPYPTRTLVVEGPVQVKGLSNGREREIKEPDTQGDRERKRYHN